MSIEVIEIMFRERHTELLAQHIADGVGVTQPFALDNFDPQFSCPRALQVIDEDFHDRSANASARRTIALIMTTLMSISLDGCGAELVETIWLAPAASRRS